MKVILFDLDGTLTDSAPGITACVQYAREKMGKPEEDADKLRCFVGPPLKDQFMSYAGFSEEEALEAVRYYRERYTKSGMYENSLYPGVEELLAFLKDRGCVLAVASSKPEQFVREILEHFHLTGYFTEIVGAGMDEKRTTKAEVIEEALKRLDMASSRQDVVMVGDRSYDIVGAHECGVQCIGVGYGYGSMEELINAGVTYVADSVEELEILAENGTEEPKVEIRSIDVTELAREQEKQQKREKRRKKREAIEKAESEQYPIHESVLKKLWRIAYPMLTHYGITSLISIVATMVMTFIGILVLGISDEADLTNMAMQQVMAITGLGGLASIPILTLYLKQDQKRRNSGKYDLQKAPEKKVTPQIVLGMILMGMGLSQVLNDLILLSGLNDIFPGYSQMGEQIYTGQSPILMLTVAAIIAPIAEELVFRGLVQMRIRDYLGPVAGIVISAICFGIYHGNMIQFIYAGILGLFLSFGMEKSQSVLVPVIGHVVANFWSLVGLSVVTAVVGDNKTIIAGVDIVMVLIFLSGLSLMGFKGKKKVKTSDTETPEEDKSEVQPKKDIKSEEISIEKVDIFSEMPKTSIEKELEAELKAEAETQVFATQPETAAEPETAISASVPETAAVSDDVSEKSEDTPEEKPQAAETSETVTPTETAKNKETAKESAEAEIKTDEIKSDL